jgi:hypothetical protein
VQVPHKNSLEPAVARRAAQLFALPLNYGGGAGPHIVE